MPRHLLALLLVLPLAAAEPVPAPAALPADAFLCVVVPDLRVALQRIEACAAALGAPVQPGQLAAAIGGRLGDPALANLAPGPVVLAVAPGGAAPTVALVAPVADGAQAVAMAQALGQQAEVHDRVVAVAGDVNGLALGRQLAAAWRTLAEDQPAADLRLQIAPARLMATYGPMLAGMRMMMQGQLARDPQMAAMAPIIALEFAAFAAIAGDVEVVQADLSLDQTAIGIDARVRAQPGGRLAAALVAPAAAADPSAGLGGGDDALMAMHGRIAIGAVTVWAADLLDDLAKQPENTALIDATFSAALRDLGDAADGAVALRVCGDDPASWRMQAAYGARDAVAFLAWNRRLLEAFGGDTALGRMYRAIGLDLTLADAPADDGSPGLRTHWEIDEAKLPAPMQAQRALFADMDLVAQPGRLVLAQGTGSLAPLLAGGPPLTTAAVRSFGADRDGWFDVDLIRYARFEMRMNPVIPPGIAAALDGVPSGEPVVGAWRTGDGRTQGELRIPLAPLAAMVQAFTAAANPAPPTF